MGERACIMRNTICPTTASKPHHITSASTFPISADVPGRQRTLPGGRKGSRGTECGTVLRQSGRRLIRALRFNEGTICAIICRHGVTLSCCS